MSEADPNARMDTMTGQALEDLVILDLSEGVAGPYCTKWFSDFGANVIKVESHAGDAARREGPFLDDVPHSETSALFLYLNTGKQSVTLDLEHEQGQDLFRRLARSADIIVEDTSPGTMAARGLAYEDLTAENPGLIFVAISPFGQTGPYRDYPVTELTAAAFSGTMSVRELVGRRPIKMGGSQSQYITGRSAFIAAMGAVLLRDLTGEGQLLDVSIQEATAINDLALPTTYSYQGLVHEPRRPPSAGGTAGVGVYACRDGSVDVLPGVGGLKKLAALLDKPELAEHPLFRDHRLRAEQADEFDEQFMHPWFKEHDREDIVERAQALGMPFSYTIQTDQATADPQLTARGFFTSVDHPVVGELEYPTTPAQLSATPGRCERAPLLGEHTEAVLCGRLELSHSELQQLREQKVVT